MKKNLKELMAKEGLLVIGIIVLAAIVIFVLAITDVVEIGEGTSQQIVTTLVFLALLALLILTAGSTACGKRGDPLPPFQHIPAPIPKARVSQRGPVILIEWEAPTRTTDGSELRLKQVEVLRRIVELPPPVLEAPETQRPRECLVSPKRKRKRPGAW